MKKIVKASQGRSFQKKYVKPELSDLGIIVKSTFGASGPLGDPGTNVGKRPAKPDKVK